MVISNLVISLVPYQCHSIFDWSIWPIILQKLQTHRKFSHEVSTTNLSEKEPFDLKNYFSKNECALQLEKNRENAWFKNHLKMTIWCKLISRIILHTNCAHTAAAKKLLKCMVTQSAAAQIFEVQCFEKIVLKYSW